MRKARSIKSTLMLLLLLLSVSSCAELGGNEVWGSGNLISESRSVSGFSEVALNGIGNLSVRQTGSESLTIEAEDNILPKLKTEVQDNRLSIGVEPNASIRATKPINYELTVKDLSALILSGSGNIDAANITSDASALNLSGSGSIDAASINADDLKVAAEGSGDVKADGKVTSQNVVISGSADYRAENLESEEAKIEVSGSGEALANISDKLEVDISGSGSVEYIGDPTIADQSISGSGALRRR